jgi:hypothetical protein
MKNGGDAKASKAEKMSSLKKTDKKASAEKARTFSNKVSNTVRKATPMLEVIVDESVPTEKEQKMLEQIKKDMDQQRDENRGATRPKRLDYVEPFKDGGMVSKGRGNGIAIRGIRKCKMS